MSEYRKIVGACGWFLEREELPLIAHRIATHSAERIKELQAKVAEQFESIDTLQRYHHKRYAALQAKVDAQEKEIKRLKKRQYGYPIFPKEGE